MKLSEQTRHDGFVGIFNILLKQDLFLPVISWVVTHLFHS